ncbi:hypothetical protein IWX49DRAFT_561661 [Phyllosticta citricarpa]
MRFFLLLSVLGCAKSAASFEWLGDSGPFWDLAICSRNGSCSAAHWGLYIEGFLSVFFMKLTCSVSFLPLGHSSLTVVSNRVQPR